MNDRGLTAYDVAGYYDEAYFADLAGRYRGRNRFARRRIANVLSLLPGLGGLTVLDVGCGMGTFTLQAAARGATAVGIDPAPAALSAAADVAQAEAGAADVSDAAHADRHDRTARGTARFVQADAALLPLASDCADIFLAADLTEHLDDVTFARVLREARRVLRAGGRLVLYTPDRQHVLERLREHGVLKQEPSHIGMRTAAELTAAVETAGFQIRAVRWLPSHLPGLDLLERGLARWVPLLRRRIGLVAERSG
jgi:SAM-dependent methyltransferase